MTAVVAAAAHPPAYPVRWWGQPSAAATATTMRTSTSAPVMIRFLVFGSTC